MSKLLVIGTLFVLAGFCEIGGVFIALALAWGVLVDEFRPDRYDLLGVAICPAGVFVMILPTRG